MGKCVKNEYERLKALYKDADPTKLALVDNLLKKASFLHSEMTELEKEIKEFGAIQKSSKGNVRVSVQYKTYLQTVGVYQNVIKTIEKIMANTASEEEDAFDEFLRKAEGS